MTGSRVRWTVVLVGVAGTTIAGLWLAPHVDLIRDEASTGRSLEEGERQGLEQRPVPRWPRSTRALPRFRQEPSMSSYQEESARPALETLAHIARTAQARGETELLARVQVERERVLRAAAGLPRQAPDED